MLVEVLQEKMLSPNKYSVIWNPKKNIAKGHYFISIMMNDLPGPLYKGIQTIKLLLDFS